MRTAMLLMLALAGCAAATARPERRAGHCDAEKAKQFLGQFGSPEIAAEARDAAGARTIRWLWPGTIVTMEYDSGRLNIELTQARTIHAVRCG